MTLLPFYSYKWKIVGLIVFLISSVLFVAAQLANVNLIDLRWTKLFINIGLIIMAFSKEKTESETVSSCRNLAYRVAFVFLFAMTVCTYFVPLATEFIFFSATLSLLVYFAVFYLSKIKIVNTEDASLCENVKDNLVYYLGIIILQIIVVLLELWNIL